METLEELKELGLDENEIKVYVSCLNNNGISVKDISKKSGLIRTTVYGVLHSLINKGLVSTMKKDGVKLFIAASPKELLNILDQKREIISSILPKLNELSKTKGITQNVEFFEGANGVKTITNDIISVSNETVKILGAGKKWIEFSRPFSTVYYRKKKEANVKTKSIATDTKEERKILKDKIVKNSEFRFLKNVDLTKSATFIYHDKVSFVNYEKESPRGFIIQDKEFNKTQNDLFDILWKIAKK